MPNRRHLDNVPPSDLAPVLGVLLLVLLTAACGTEATRPEEPLAIDGVTPSLGALTGNVALDITGTGFSDVVQIAVGDSVALYFIVRSSTHISALLPAVAAPGDVDVVVTSQRHGAATCTACFRYYDSAWTVTAISPDTGALDGGMPVTITGTGFDEVTGVTIGGVPLDSVIVVSPTQITGVTHAQEEPGVRDVVVTSAQGGEQICRGCFTYQLDVVAHPLAAGGWHTCALTGDGEAYCWGGGGNGELGDGVVTGSPVPVAVAGGHRFRAIAAGDHYTCGLTSSGVAYCWGHNTSGQLGNGTQVRGTVPVAVSGDLTFSVIDPGDDFNCGLTRSGTGYCWGLSYRGVLGSPGWNTNLPRPVTGGLTFNTLSTGNYHVCALTVTGVAYCWGSNSLGRLGDGTTEGGFQPRPVSGGLQFSAISAGEVHTCARTPGGVVYCWGEPVGNSNFWTSPTELGTGITFQFLQAGYGHTCGIDVDGTTYCWGFNWEGQLGDSSTTSRAVPVAVTGGHEFLYVAGGHAHTCGRTRFGVVYCWGSNDGGQLGNGTLESSTVPVAVLPFGASPPL